MSTIAPISLRKKKSKCWSAGIIQAVREVGVQVPVIVRLEGTNVELGRKMLAESGLKIVSAESLTEAAKLAVASV